MQKIVKRCFGYLLFVWIFVPNIVLAADTEQRSLLHILYEKTFGAIGTVAGIIAMVVLWQVSRSIKDENVTLILKMFVLILFFINIGSASFGIHGVGILDGETSRYIERTCRLIALFIADIVALKIFLMYKRKDNFLKVESK